MIKKLKIGKINLCFVFRHKWDIPKEKRWFNSEFKSYRLSIWYKTNLLIGKKDFNKPSKWNKNLCLQHMFGIDLIICKFWFTVDIGAMNLKLNE